MNLIDKFTYKAKRILLVLNSLKKIYRYGGYSTVNVSNINYGGILRGKRIIITGGGTGIGFSIAQKCLKEGAAVVITGRNVNKLNEAKDSLKNGLLKTLVWDVCNISEIKEHIEEAEKLLGGEIDILVNNAGVLADKQFPNVSENDWDKVYTTNSKGLFFITQFLCDKWMNRTDLSLKKVLNISSQGGFIGATYPYRMTKWDVVGLTQGLGLRLAPHGIIVNGIAPGVIATNMQPRCQEQKENIFYEHNPIQRFAMPEEIAELAVFLLSDAANFIVGQTVICDGGYSLK